MKLEYETKEMTAALRAEKCLGQLVAWSLHAKQPVAEPPK